MPISFEKEFDPAYGTAVKLCPSLFRLTVNNPSPFTYCGTNSYIIGDHNLAIIDPGPIDENHRQALIDFVGARTVSHILVTHCHMDHSPLAKHLGSHFNAPVVAGGPYKTSRTIQEGEGTALDGGAQKDFTPDIILHDNDTIEGDGWSLTAVSTPGHMANHLSFSWNEAEVLFTGDHVMAWSTSVIAPPDGSMKDYMESLDKLLARQDRLYLPGHGGPVFKPHAFVRGMKAHRKMRECAILERLRQGDRLIAEMVKVIYRDTDPKLHRAAGLSVFAHLEDMVTRGLVQCDGTPHIDSAYSLS